MSGACWRLIRATVLLEAVLLLAVIGALWLASQRASSAVTFRTGLAPDYTVTALDIDRNLTLQVSQSWNAYAPASPVDIPCPSEYPGTWAMSPDGTQVVYSCTIADANWGLYLAPADTPDNTIEIGLPMEPGRFHSAVWSPDSTRFLVQHIPDNARSGQYWVFTPQTKCFRPVFDSDNKYNVQWLPVRRGSEG